MYDFHYNFQVYYVFWWNFDLNLLFTDTDSLTYEIKLKGVYKECFKHKQLFDFNEFQSTFLIQRTKEILAKWQKNLKEFW